MGPALGRLSQVAKPGTQGSHTSLLSHNAGGRPAQGSAPVPAWPPQLAWMAGTQDLRKKETLSAWPEILGPQSPWAPATCSPLDPVGAHDTQSGRPLWTFVQRILATAVLLPPGLSTLLPRIPRPPQPPPPQRCPAQPQAQLPGGQSAHCCCSSRDNRTCWSLGDEVALRVVGTHQGIAKAVSPPLAEGGNLDKARVPSITGPPCAWGPPAHLPLGPHTSLESQPQYCFPRAGSPCALRALPLPTKVAVLALLPPEFWDLAGAWCMWLAGGRGKWVGARVDWKESRLWGRSLWGAGTRSAGTPAPLLPPPCPCAVTGQEPCQSHWEPTADTGD